MLKMLSPINLCNINSNKYERYYWTRNEPACLLTLLCHYCKPPAHKYPSLCCTNWLQRHASSCNPIGCSRPLLC